MFGMISRVFYLGMNIFKRISINKEIFIFCLFYILKFFENFIFIEIVVCVDFEMCLRVCDNVVGCFNVVYL